MGLRRLFRRLLFGPDRAEREIARLGMITRTRWADLPPGPPVSPPAPAGYCSASCPGWAPFDQGTDRHRIQRCDDCSHAAGVAGTYDDDDAEGHAATWAARVLLDSPEIPVCSYHVAHVVAALRATPSGRVALANALLEPPL